MGGAKYNILVKFTQQQRMNDHFYGKTMLDALSLLHFSDSLSYESSFYIKK